jgi:LIM domain kinase 1
MVLPPNHHMPNPYLLTGNLRQYIHDKSKPLPWRLRLSFATDIARALAYLHARKCIHRDLKGENLLVTTNGRLKITDFGFARIAARNKEESRRLTFCGTDAYMSPEILLGHEFDLPTDIFSFGVILAELAARHLADDHHFARAAPSFAVDADEVLERANSGCPTEFTRLAIECIDVDSALRPTTRAILDRLRSIEADVLARGEETELHTGSVKFMSGQRRHHAAVPRIPSFGQGIGGSIRLSVLSSQRYETSEDEEEELSDAVSRLESVTVVEDGVPLASTVSANGNESQQALLGTRSEYSTTVIRGQIFPQSTFPPPLSSILTVRASPIEQRPPIPNRPLPAEPESTSAISVASYYTASDEEEASIAAATEGSSSHLLAAVHRFTLIKPGTTAKRITCENTAGSSSAHQGWSALDFFFAGGGLLLGGGGVGGGGGKCDICSKKLGRKAVLECDDCGLRAHVKCGEDAPRDCAIRAAAAVNKDKSPYSHR